MSETSFSETAVGFELYNLKEGEGEASYSVKYMMLEHFSKIYENKKNPIQINFYSNGDEIHLSRNRAEHLPLVWWQGFNKGCQSTPKGVL